jgi:hypothetical protein
MFLPSRSHLTITVPACKTCNGGASKAEDDFRVFMSVKDGRDTPEFMQFWRDGPLNAVKNNRRLHRELLSGARLLMRSPLTGNFEPRQLFKWDLRESHDPIIRKMTRALYYHNYKSPFDPHGIVKVAYLPKLTNEMIDFCYQNLIPGDTGGDPRFVYAYNRSNDHPEQSIWVFQFYRRHRASAFTQLAPAVA